MDALNRLEEIFQHFPGIGRRQAKRFVYFLLSKPNSYTNELIKLIEEVRKSTHECSSCHRIFQGKKNCSVCENNSRDVSSLMIVARDSDFESIEKSGAYNGIYFILGGSIPLLDKEPEKRVRLKDLLNRVAKDKDKIQEIILSLNATADGEHTASVIKEELKKIFSKKITILGRGLSTGSELEYADPDTIRNALNNRQ